MSDSTIVNGINLEAFQDALKTVGAQPAAARAPKASRVRWLEGLKFKAYVRNHTFVVDEPVARQAPYAPSTYSIEFGLISSPVRCAGSSTMKVWLRT